MKSTILKIIVKEWFKDRLGGELEDGVLEAIIKELTEKKDNRITITDIEPKHYESEKDAEANKESDWISVKDKMPKHNKYFIGNNIIMKTVSGEEIKGFTCKNTFYKYNGDYPSCVTHWKYRNNEPKEEEQETSRTAGETMFIAEVRELNSDIKIYHVVNSRNKDEAVLKVEKYYEIKAELNGRCYVINIKDYEYIS